MQKAGYISLLVRCVTCMVAVLSFGVSHVDAAVFSRTLSIGSTGSDVVLLQTFLNVSPTGYFGPLTSAAVSRFQEANASEILSPSGLSRGTGTVGPLTLAALNRRISPAPTASATTTSTPVTVSSPVSSPQISSNQSSGSISIPTQGPNTKNLDKFLAAMSRVSAKNGLTQAQIDVLKTEIIKQATGTTTDFRQDFIKSVRAKNGLSDENTKPKSLLAQAADSLVRAGRDFLGIKQAEAVLDLPFGGELLYSYPCYCSGSIYLTIEPLPPEYTATLTYTPFSQAYLSYNIPYTEWLLGKYTPAVGRCLIPAYPTCYYIPAEGQVSPTVGSSSY